MQKVTEGKNFRWRSAVRLRIARISTIVVINTSRNTGEKIGNAMVHSRINMGEQITCISLRLYISLTPSSQSAGFDVC